MAEQRITTKPTVNALLDEDYIFINHDGALRQVRKSDTDLASSADLQEFEESETAAREQFEENLTEANEEFAESVTEQIANKADIGGNYEDLTSGTSEQLLSTQSTEDKVPYLFRKSIAGDRELDTLVGGSVAWNQLIDPRENTVSGIHVTVSNGKFVINGTASSAGGGRTMDLSNVRPNIVSGHKYIILTTLDMTGITGFFLSLASQPSTLYGLGTGNMIVAPTFSGTSIFGMNLVANAQINTSGYIQLFDLTKMFGTAIADRLYAMEQANAGSGVALFRSWFPKDYYAYNAGELMSVKTTAHEMVGKNFFDDNFTHYEMPSDYRICPLNLVMGEQYVLSAVSDTSVKGVTIGIVKSGRRYADFDGFSIIINNQGQVPSYNNPYRFIATEEWKDANLVIFARTEEEFNKAFKAFKPQLEFGTTPTEYEPYQKRTYALDDIELRGVPKLVDGEIQYDGDTYEADGKVTRRFGIVDMGTLNWEYLSDDAIFRVQILNAKTNGINVIANIVNPLYSVIGNTYGSGLSGKNKCMNMGVNNTMFQVCDSAYTTAAAFKSAMSGVYLVYELATPTTETADPYTSPQVVDAYGTERYVDERTVAVPVGHVTKYPDNLREKLDGLPWDFSTLIAPTEKAYTATRNYTTGSLFIVGNILYKATANIANGGAITPNTNCTATTLAEVISAL